MTKLKQQLWMVVKEYTRQIKNLMEASELHWIGTDDTGYGTIDVLDIDSTYFLSLTDVQLVIDNLDQWVELYGSHEAVAQEIRDWQDWWLNDDDKDSIVDLYESRYERYERTYPRINLKSWLLGCPREKPTPSIEYEIRELKVQSELVKELGERYRDSSTLYHAYGSLLAELKEKEKIKAKRDAEEFERIKQTEAYTDFEQAIEEGKPQAYY